MFFDENELAFEYYSGRKGEVSNGLWRPISENVPIPNFKSFRENKDKHKCFFANVADEYVKISYCSHLGFVHVMIKGDGKKPSSEVVRRVKRKIFGDKYVLQIHPKKEDRQPRKDTSIHLWSPISEDLPIPSILQEKKQGERLRT